MTEHRDKHGKQSIGHSSKGAPVRVAALSKRGVVSLGVNVPLRTDASPVIHRVSQPRIASSAHEHLRSGT